MASSSKPSELHIANGLRLAAEDLSAADTLLESRNRYSAYHLQQCAEKILLALLTSESIQIERKDSHRIDVLKDKLPNQNPFKERFKGLSALTLFATTYRYPKDGGRIPSMPNESDIQQWASELHSLVSDVATHFGVDLTASDTDPAQTTAPPRS